jgi:smad nuclear-interacting protein 1
VQEVRVAVDKSTGQSRGFAFVVFEEEGQAAAALAADGEVCSFAGRGGLRVAWAKAKHSGGPERVVRRPPAQPALGGPPSGAPHNGNGRLERPLGSGSWGEHREGGGPGQGGAQGTQGSSGTLPATPNEEVPINFGLSGKLAAETNTVNGVELKYAEPSDARKPPQRWRLYVYKNEKLLDGANGVLHLHRKSCYVLGRERRAVDIPTDHPSCSKQHAVIQFREVHKKGTDGREYPVVRPYLMDLGSTNGTVILGKDAKRTLEPERFYELLEGDTVKFGLSSREYVLLHEDSKSL